MRISVIVQLAAIAAPVFTALIVAWFSSSQALALAREERMQDRKAEAYVELAKLVVRLRQYALAVSPGIDDDSALHPPPMGEDQRYRMYALVESYGSSEIKEQYDELLEAHAGTRTAVAHLEDVRDWNPPFTRQEQDSRRNAVEDLRGSREELKQICGDVLETINEELSQRGDQEKIARAVLAAWILAVATVAGIAGLIIGAN